MTSTPDAAVSPPRVAVLGIGAMGVGMVGSLRRAGLAVDVWNRTPGPAAALAGPGVTAHPEPAAAVAGADVVVTMLADAGAVRSVALEAGMLAALRPGAVWAQMGTIGVAATEDLAATVAARRPDVDFVDAPVSGSRGPAAAGELVILASGPQRARATVEPVFGALGKQTRWLAESAGEGTRLKLVTNAWLCCLIESAAEVLALADSLGVDRSDVLGLLSTGRMSSAVAAGKARKMDSGDDSPEFPLQWALKDVRLALDAAPDRALAGLEAIRDRWQALADRGLGGLDTSAARHGLQR